MTIPALLILLSLFDKLPDLSKISKENALKKQAEIAYKEGRFPDAIANLKTLVQDMNVSDEKAVLDLGHAYFKNNDVENASKTYEKALLSTDKSLKSIASQQLGILSFQADKDKEKALAFFKEALRANPNNTEARHNYELLKKAVDQENKDDKNQENKNQDKKDDKKEGQDKKDNKDGKGNKDQKDNKEQNKDGKGDKDQKGDKGKDNKDEKGDKKEGSDPSKDEKSKDGKGDKDKKEQNKDPKEDSQKDKKGAEKQGDKNDKDEQAKGNKDEKGQNKDAKKEGKEDKNGEAQKEKQGGKNQKDKVVVNPEALAQMGMSEQKAKAILNAMRSNETQYIQQVKREPTKKNKKGKPDW
ncbi:MAG: tetratricopeptide repeat protein [Cytophagales bacterium]